MYVVPRKHLFVIIGNDKCIIKYKVIKKSNYGELTVIVAMLQFASCKLCYCYGNSYKNGVYFTNHGSRSFTGGFFDSNFKF